MTENSELPDEQAADLEALAQQAGQGMAEQTVQQIAETGNMPTVEIVRPVVALACATLAPAWNITEAEQEQLSGVYAAVLDKYFPGGVAMGPELAAVLVTAGIVLPRLGQPRKIDEKPADEDR